MPTTIALSEKQRATLTALHNQVATSQARVDAYCSAVLDGSKDTPKDWAGISITDEGLVLGDAPPAPPAEPAKES